MLCTVFTFYKQVSFANFNNNEPICFYRENLPSFDVLQPEINVSKLFYYRGRIVGNYKKLRKIKVKPILCTLVVLVIIKLSGMVTE